MNRHLNRLLAVLAVIGAASWGCSPQTPPPGEDRAAGDVFRDVTTTASVKLALAFEPGVSATGIDVDTDGGTVTLSGEVDSEAERQLAKKVAEDVGGVEEVMNQIQVRE